MRLITLIALESTDSTPLTPLSVSVIPGHDKTHLICNNVGADRCGAEPHDWDPTVAVGWQLDNCGSRLAT